MKKFLIILLANFSFLATAQKELNNLPPKNDPIRPIDVEPIDGTYPGTVPIIINPQVPRQDEVGLTEGQLSVSLSGAATYNVPIAVPPGLVGVMPQIGLSYSSQGGNGNAGYGWSISDVSSISRIPSTMFHDGVIDGVDFDNLDRFALDGQRLIVKNGTTGVYGANGTYYETENYSNLKISTWGVHPNGSNYGPAYFQVEYPDGSIALYGYVPNATSITEWGIYLWQNAQAVRIDYKYTTSNNSLEISSIKYGAVPGSNTYPNEISFIYKNRQRPESAYLGGILIEKKNILSIISVKGNNVGFRNYQLFHNVSSLGYKRLESLFERTGDNTKALKPLVFSYEDTPENISYVGSTSNIFLNNVNSLNHKNISGDFNGDGSLDFILTSNYSPSEYTIFNSNPTTNTFTGKKITGTYYDSIFATSFLTGYSNSDYKLMPKQCWTTVNANSTLYKTYSIDDAQNVILESQKSIAFPTAQINSCQQDPNYGGCGLTEIDVSISKKTIDGDFNGDGLTDVIAIENYKIQSANDCNTVYDDYGNSSCTVSSYSNGSTYNKVYLVNLDKRVSNASSMVSVGQLTNYINGYFTTQVIDFNGDGKSDFMIVENGKATVYSLNNSNQLVVLCTVQNGSINPLKRVLIGDYNGDGNSDFIVFKETTFNYQVGYKHIYVRFLSTGVTFNIAEMYYDLPNKDDKPNITYNVIPNDMNGDGKTDLILVKYYEDVSNNQPGFISFKIFKNQNNNFISDFYTTTGFQNSIVRNPIPIFLNSNYLNKKQELAFLSGNSIYHFQSNKDLNKDRLIRKITNGNGVQENIAYKSLEDETYNVNSIYKPSTLTELYPRTDITNAPTLQVVSKLEKQSATVFKKQLFSYYGAVSDISGLGFLGFRATMKTNWHDDSHQIMSTVSKSDINLRGANVENYTMLGLQNPSNPSPFNNFISKTNTVYNQYTGQAFENPLQPNKVFKLKQTESVQINGLENTSVESVTKYDLYNNPEEATTTVKNAGVTEQVTNTKITFENLPTALPFIIGRPKIKLQTVTSFPTADVSSSEERYDYQNGLLTKIQRRGTNSGQTTPFMTEDNVYDGSGNITQKTITAVGLAPRITNYEYNPAAPFNGRFLTKSTDIEGLQTSFDYNANNGTLIKETNPFGLKTYHFYDKWFKKIKITDYLTKSKNFRYERSGNETTITTTADDDSESFETFDDLGRKTYVGFKTIDDNITQTNFLYDLYDRNYLSSEPFFDSPEQWNETEYDIYSRPIKNTKHTGKIVNIIYNGLTTTVDDGLKTKSSLKNALGQVTSMTDTPGGTVVYNFFANGNLRQTVFDTATTTIEQDDYGRKVKLTDPSAGIFKYSFNAFGETLSETKFDSSGTTPTGITIYVINAVGKTDSKTVKGFGTDTTNTISTYVYDPSTKLLNSSQFQDIANNTATSYSYTYDATNRLISKSEQSNYAIFTQNYLFDAFGRIKQETQSATHILDGQNATKNIAYFYKNGVQHQIIDVDKGQLLHQTDAVDQRGNITVATLGDNMVQVNTFDSFGYAEQSDFIVTAGPNATGASFLKLNTTFDAPRGNLIKRTNSMFGVTDNFTYDNQDRLTKFPTATGTLTTQSYDDKGKIKANNIGNYAYTIPNKPYQVSTVTPPFLGAPSQRYYEQREQNVLYNFFKSPISISVDNKETIYFEYNDANQRSAMFYGDTSPNKSSTPLRKYYASDGSMEIKYNATTGATEFVTYIAGDAYSAPLIIKSDGTTETAMYLHRDYQGTILAITDYEGKVLESRYFDAWGNIIKLRDSNNNVVINNGILINASYQMLTDRGYTGHEHLQGVELINMNARLYDPAFHRFLQPDNFVQDPSNTQNYNRYGYCLNNPLMYTDPSGELLWFVPLIYAAVNLGVDMIQNKGNMNFGQIAMSLGQGALSGALGGATSVGGAFLGAGIGQLNRFMPAIPLYQSAGFNLSISPFIGFGSSGFAGGVNLNASGQVGDFAYSASVGVGFNSGTSSLGESSGGSGFWNAGGFAGYNDGHANYGLDYSYNSFGGKSSQGVGAVTIQAGDFGFRLDEDAFIEDNGDRSRTGGMLMTYRVNGDLTLAFGASMMTGEATGDDDHTQGNPNYYKKGHPMEGQMVGTHRGEKNPNLRAGTMYGGVIYKGQASFYGHNSEKRLHSVQNWIHKNVVHYTPYFADRGFSSKPYSYSGSYHSSYLYY